MTGWKGMSIAQRLAGLCVVLSTLLVGLAGFTYVNLQQVWTAADTTEKRRVPQLTEVAEIELQITRLSLQLRHAMLSRTPQEKAETMADIQAKRARTTELVKQYESELFTAEGKARFAKLAPLMDAFWSTAGKNIALIEADQRAEAFAFLVEQTIPARNQVLAVLDETVKYQQGALTREIDQLKGLVDRTLQAELGLFALAIGVLAALSWSVTRLLLRRIAASQDIAARVSSGDLATPVRDDRRDEFSPLLAALGDMQHQLAGVVAKVRENASTVSAASAEIARGNLDLSTRTEQQATALQQTTSTMSLLGDAVRQNAQRAEQANEMASTATAVAERGGTVVGQVVDTMTGINDASAKMADIVGVINGIAFQTNILALNAAVEAARAGEQGRGFAVVASEVRSLAQRSASAAQEIKGLIQRNVERVERGNALVADAGQSMQDIVGAIGRVHQIVGEIAGASQHQSAGVTQVGQTIGDIDSSTQQNAALVEQSAAAASTLRSQAENLVKAVAAFHLQGAARLAG